MPRRSSRPAVASDSPAASALPAPRAAPRRAPCPFPIRSPGTPADPADASSPLDPVRRIGAPPATEGDDPPRGRPDRTRTRRSELRSHHLRGRPAPHAAGAGPSPHARASGSRRSASHRRAGGERVGGGLDRLRGSARASQARQRHTSGIPRHRSAHVASPRIPPRNPRRRGAPSARLPDPTPFLLPIHDRLGQTESPTGAAKPTGSIAPRIAGNPSEARSLGPESNRPGRSPVPGRSRDGFRYPMSATA